MCFDVSAAVDTRRYLADSPANKGELSRRPSSLRVSARSFPILIDAEKAIVVDVEAKTAIRQAEVRAKRMVERSLNGFDLYPENLIDDTADGTAEMLIIAYRLTTHSTARELRR